MSNEFKNVKEMELNMQYLAKIFSLVLQGQGQLPETWLESAMIFKFKAGDRENPDNFRTLFIQSPFLKTFMAVTRNRHSKIAEDNNIRNRKCKRIQILGVSLITTAVMDKPPEKDDFKGPCQNRIHVCQSAPT